MSALQEVHARTKKRPTRSSGKCQSDLPGAAGPGLTPGGTVGLGHESLWGKVTVKAKGYMVVE